MMKGGAGGGGVLESEIAMTDTYSWQEEVWWGLEARHATKRT